MVVFSGTIVDEVTNDFRPPNLERAVIDGGKILEPFCQIICLNHPQHSIFIEGLNLNVVTTAPKISNAKAEPIALIRH
jgi:hypothetical protein